MNAKPRKTTSVRGKFRPSADGSALPTMTFALSNESTRANLPPTARDEFMKTWAPPGSGTWYMMTIEQSPGSGRQSIEASLAVPGADAWELGEARLSRIGGRTPEDQQFRNQLFLRIGSAVVAGGRIEAAMKRLIEHMSGSLEPSFANSNDQWKTLDRNLRKVAANLGNRAADVVKVLDWGRENGIREIRNDIVHAYWWDYSDVGITRGRVHLDGTSELIQITPDQLDHSK